MKKFIVKAVGSFTSHLGISKALTATTTRETMAVAWPLLPPPLNSSSSSPITIRPTSTTSKPQLLFTNRTQSSKSKRGTVLITNATPNKTTMITIKTPIHRLSTLLDSLPIIPRAEVPFRSRRAQQRLAMSAKCSMTEYKGKEYGSTIKSGKLRWFVRETGSVDSRRGTIVFLHGAPTQSFSYRNVMSQLSDLGFHCFAPDWIGFGFSDKPQPGYGFDYTEKEFHDGLDNLLDVLGVKSPFYLVVQGFLVGSYGLTWALKNPSRISKLAILNSPLTTSSPVPGLIPFFGEFTCQNAIMAERFIEAGSAYVLKLEKADVYRLPYLSSGGPGFALLEAARKANFKNILSQIEDGFASERWDAPILVAWGLSDKYLPQSIAEEFQKRNPSSVKLKLIEGAGHMPQEDWPEKVVDALRAFF
ncbi:hypothetical protein F8388_026989 [Cannabis sativa]|uniref:AB hydrolase-1 domain-containing protein n=1 Tax=Cannabis sativa TaxID=3483 RepID=A0A7J6FNM2_CANSA|nr:hypothetical protein F8388_026989 [Cannabis sativa]